MNVNKLLFCAAMSAGSMVAAAAPVSPVQLTFEGLSRRIEDPHSLTKLPNVLVYEYYNGGYSLNVAGDEVSGPGDEFGISIRGNETYVDGTLKAAGSVFAIEQGAIGGSGAFTSDPSLRLGTAALGLLEQGNVMARLHLKPGASFNDGLSFYYIGFGNNPLQVQIIYAEKDKDGVPLSASFTLPVDQSCTGQNLPACTWLKSESDKNGLGSLNFGTVTDILFVGSLVLIDNITLGSANPGTIPATPAVPEPATYALMAFGLAAIALTARRRSRQG